MQSKQCTTRRACQARRAVATPIAQPVTTAACAPCGARNSVVGRYAAATAAAGPAEPAAVAAAAKTRQGKTTHVFPAILWRYPGDTLKWKKRTPRHQSPSSFQHNHISKFQKGKTQHNPIPNGTDTLGKFQTCKKAGKTINNQNHVFQTQAGRRTHRLPQFFPPN